MSHETHHHETGATPKTSLSTAFWFGIILVGLLVASFNFIRVMSHDEGGHGGHEAHTTEQHDADHGHTNHGTAPAEQHVPADKQDSSAPEEHGAAH